MIRTGLLCAMLTLCGCAGAGWQPVASAPPPSRPTELITVLAPAWRVGSEWNYSDGYGLIVQAVNGPTTTFHRTDDPPQWVVRRGFLREDSQSATNLRRVMFEDLPPGAGATLDSREPVTYRREYQAGTRTYVHATSWTVEGRDRVKVPAGEFDCVILVMRTRNLEDGWTGFERWWFSPAAQSFVRMEYRYGDNPPGSRVLMTYHLAAP